MKTITKRSRLTRSDLQNKLAEQEFKCALTGLPLTPQTAWLDHIDAKAVGGCDDRENVQIVLAAVNRAKTTMSQSQFVAMCHAVARHSVDTGDRSWIGGPG